MFMRGCVLYLFCKARISSSAASAISSVLLAAVCALPFFAMAASPVTDIPDSKPVPGLEVDASELKLFSLSQTLLQDPQNPELLLKKGVLLFELGKTQAAFEIFESLRVTFPNHPAPYANLASVYARLGRLEESRQMLMISDGLQGNRFQTQLSLASVNLGLALAALGKANDLNPNDVATQRKLRSLEKYIAESNKAPFSSDADPATKLATGARNTNQESNQRLSKAAKVRQASNPGPVRDRLSLSMADTEDSPPPSPINVPAVAVARPPPTLSTTVGSNEDARKAQVLKAIAVWGKAWTQRAYGDYLAGYSANFQPSDDTTREMWTDRKRAVMEKAKYIKVEIKVSSVQVTGNTATVKLSQHYRSDRHSDFSRKELTLGFEEGGWKILAEKPVK